MIDTGVLESNQRFVLHPQAGCLNRNTHSDSERGLFPVVIREADKADSKVLAEVLRRSFRDVAERFGLTPENCPRSVAFHTDERVEADFARGMQYYILQDNGTARGCVALERPEPEFCYMGRLALLPECRRKGLGKALATRAFYEAWALGVRRVEIGMIAADVKLSKWYARLGFVPNGTKQIDGFPFEVGFMVKKV